MFSFCPKNSRSGSRKASITHEWLVVESSSKCNLHFQHADRNLVIILELTRKVEYNWACTF